MVAEAVDSVDQLENQARHLASQINTLTHRLDARLPDLRAAAPNLTPEKLAERINQGPRTLAELLEKLDDRARVTRSILVLRLEDETSPTRDFQQLQAQVVASEAGLDYLRLATQHQFFPEDVLHQRVEEHRRLLAQYRDVAERKISQISSGVVTPIRSPQRAARVSRVVAPIVFLPEPPVPPVSSELQFEDPPVEGATAETVVKPGVKYVRKDGQKFYYDVTLPGGNTISIEGMSNAKTFEKLLASNTYLTQKEIARLGWGSDEPRYIATVSPALTYIRAILFTKETGHILDEKKVPSGRGTRQSTAYLIKDTFNRQSLLVTPVSPPESVAISVGSKLEKLVVSADVMEPEVAAETGLAVEPEEPIIQPTSDVTLEAPVAEVPAPGADLDSVPVQPVSRHPVPNTPGLPLGALVAPAVKNLDKPIIRELPIPSDPFTKLKAPTTNVIYRGPGADKPGYRALKILATEEISPAELIRVASKDGTDVAQAIENLTAAIRGVLFDARIFSTGLDSERKAIWKFIRDGLEGEPDIEIVAAYQRVFTRRFSKVESSAVPVVVQAERTTIIRAVSPPRPEIAEATVRRLAPVPESMAYVGLRTWITKPSLSAGEMVKIVCGTQEFDKKKALDDLEAETKKLLEKQASGARLNIEELAIIRSLKSDLGGKTDAEIVSFTRNIFELWFVDAEPVVSGKATTRDEIELISEVTPQLENKVKGFIGKLRSKTTDGYVSKGVALKADGSFGTKRLDSLNKEGILRAFDTNDRGRVYNIIDLTRAHFEDDVTADVLAEIEAIAQQELA